MERLKQLALKKLEQRGVTVKDIAELTMYLQQNYNKITIEECEKAVLKVIGKHESLHAILIGISLDELAEKDIMDKEINKFVREDNSLFGIDEILALSIVNMHGSIALTNFGYIDKIKPGIIGKIDKLGKSKQGCYTFLDDIIGAIAASAASSIAHAKVNIDENI